MQILRKGCPFSYTSKAQISVLKYSFSDAKTNNTPLLERSYSTRWKAIIPPLERLLSSRRKSSSHPLISIHTTVIRSKVLRVLWQWGSHLTHTSSTKSSRPDKYNGLSGRGHKESVVGVLRALPREQRAWLSHR